MTTRSSELAARLAIEEIEPFPGFHPFSESEQHFFFGCQITERRIMEQLSEKRFIILHGPKGSGKTSLLSSIGRRVKTGLIRGEPSWTTFYTSPGRHPTGDLARELATFGEPAAPPNTTSTTIDADEPPPGFIAKRLEEIAEKTSSKVLFIIDHAEDIFDDATSLSEATKYISHLSDLAYTPSENYCVAVSVCTESLYALLDRGDLANLAQTIVPSLKSSEYLEAALEPARIAEHIISRGLPQEFSIEVQFDEKLSELLLSTRQRTSSDLRMMQHCLRQVWNIGVARMEFNDGKFTIPFTADEFYSAGGIPGSIEQQLEEQYRNLEPQDQTIVRAIFTSLIGRTPRGGLHRLRATVDTIAEFCGLDTEAILRVTSHFSSTSQAFRWRAGALEISDDLILEHWHRIRTWTEAPIRDDALAIARNAIFISYRRSDTLQTAKNLYDALKGIYGSDRVFLDLDSIPFGANFRNHIQTFIAKSAIFVLLIGQRWMQEETHGVNLGRCRLENPYDLVRVEIETAIDSGINIIPYLVNGVQEIPGPLPSSLATLPNLNAIVDFGHSQSERELIRLLQAIEGFLTAPAIPR